MKRVVAILSLLCALPQVATGHSFVRYVSTPITPPDEFQWWFPVAIAVLLSGTFVIIWRLLDRRWFAAIALSICTVVVFAVTYFMFGRFAAVASTAPPAGLGFPYPTFWGMGWRRVGLLFVLWNLYGCGFFLGSLFLFGGIRRTRRRFMKLAPCAVALYAITLVLEQA